MRSQAPAVFFQAGDGIRDHCVTGVQTCALPIYLGQIPNINGAGPISFGLGSPGWHNDGKDYAFTQNLTKVWKSHVMKFGYYYNRDNKKQTANWGFNGEINFNNYNASSMPLDTGKGLANLMLGNFNSYTI